MSIKHYICEFLINSLVVLHLEHWSVEAYRPNNYTLIDLINSQHLTWTAGENPTNIPGPMPAREPKKSALPILQRDVVRTPHTFDARSHWPHCRSIIDQIRAQGECGSCWAVAAASVLSDRMCIESRGYYRLHLSAEDVLTCCSYCATPEGGGCGGGSEHSAMTFWSRSGIVTGGELGSKYGCKPYSWDSFNNKNMPCKRSCTNSYYRRAYSRDKYRGRIAYRVPPHEEAIMSEIFQYGPVTAGIRLYEDFYQYRNGVYIHKTGPYKVGHAMRIIGWGVEDGVKYWLVPNSHGRKFGMDGYIKFLRGENHCGIEADIGAASLYRSYGSLSDGDTMRQAAISSASIRSVVLMEKSLLYTYCIWIFFKQLNEHWF